MFAPPFDRPTEAAALLRGRGYAIVDPAGTATVLDTSIAALDALVPSWDALEPDRYLKDGGAYRRRRHASFVVDGDRIERAPHRAHWQPVEYNALHGGMRRWFEPVGDTVVASSAWRAVLAGLARLGDAVRGRRTRWFVEAHQFRIDAAGGIGRPTPEGAHRDGVDFVAVVLVARRGIKGGETRVFDADGPDGHRFTMTAPWTMLLLDDARMIHETTPIQPDGVDAAAIRDTLVVTLREGGFQGD